MHRRARRLFLLSLALLCYSVAARTETARVAFIDVNVLPMDSQRILRRQTVLTAGDQIVAIGPVNKISVPADAVKVTGGDHAYLLPGLADMHTHVEDPNDLNGASRTRWTEYLADPRARVISPSVRLNWTRDWRSQRSGDISPIIAFLQTFTKALHEAGVPLLMGTDSPPIPGIYAGYSVHDDLHYLHAAGLTNYETLVAATRNAGDFIVKSVPGAQRFGQLKVGMRADAVLVNGNPFDSLEVLKTQSGVLSGGRWTSAQEVGEKIEAQRKLYQSLY